jgi:hypothetical protein
MVRVQRAVLAAMMTSMATPAAAQVLDATYRGTFVRRSAKFKGTQTWTGGGKTVTRACAGAIKRPLRPFLPRMKKQAAAW